MLELTIHESFPLKDDSKYIDVVSSVAKQWGTYIHLHPATIPFDRPATLHFNFYCENKCDPPHKIISDGHRWIVAALVAVGVFPGFGWKYVGGFVDRVLIDGVSPRVVVWIV